MSKVTKDGKVAEFTATITADEFREFIAANKHEGRFSEYFDTGVTDHSFWIKQDRTEEVPGYTTRIIIRPQANSVRLTIKNEFREGEEYPAPFLAWDLIRGDLERSGYEVRDVTGNAITAVFEHSYVDPGTILNPNHRKIIRALIEAELSPERVFQKEIAERLGFSESTITEVKRIYLRPEFKNPN